MAMLIAVVFVVLLASPCAGQTPRSGRIEELKQLSIEELIDTDVTSPSRRIERLADVAAAVTIITGEDLRRMGVMSLAQALRLAGHLNVAQVSGPQYAVSVRGFSISTANKMLVLIDGRTVYSPVFLPRWQVHASHMYHWKELTFDPGSNDPTRGTSEANDPSNIFKLRSYINATERIEIDTFYRWYDELPQPWSMPIASWTHASAIASARAGTSLSLARTFCTSVTWSSVRERRRKPTSGR